MYNSNCDSRMSAFYAINFPSAGRKRNTLQTPPLLLFANNLSFLLASAKTKLELQASNKKNSAKKLNFKIMWSTEIRTVVFSLYFF